MAYTKTVSWTIPTTNVDGTPIAAGEITGYTIGIRPASGTAGTYPVTQAVPNAAATTAAVSLSLPSGNYFVSVQADGPQDSAWSTETAFTLAPIPNPPTGVVVV